jgi:hypothetical protein
MVKAKNISKVMIMYLDPKVSLLSIANCKQAATNIAIMASNISVFLFSSTDLIIK